MIDKYASAGPDEPLLFLYPRWFSNAVQSSTAQQSPSTVASGDGSGNKTAAEGQAQQSRNSRSQLQAQETCNADTSQSANGSVPGHGRRAVPRDDGGKAFPIMHLDLMNLGNGSGSGGKLSSSVLHPDGKTGASSKSPNDTPPNNTPIPRSRAYAERLGPRPPRIIRTGDDANFDHTTPPPTNQPSTPPSTSIPLSRTYSKKPTSLPSLPVRIRRIQSDSEETHQKIKRYQESKRKGTEDPYIKSIESLERLSRAPKSTKAIPARDQKEIYLSEEALNILAGQSEENKWVIYNRSGCQIHVLGADQSDGSNRKAILSGSPRAIELAEESIAAALAAQGLGSPSNAGDQFSILPSPHSTQTGGKLRIRRVWVPQRRERHSLGLDQVRPEVLPRPEEWTVLNFADYVQELTDLNVPRSMHRQLYQEGETHVSTVSDTLYTLFDDPSNEEFFSSRAINLAIEFFYHHRYVPSVRSLFSKFVPFLTVDSFNIMLRSIAGDKDIHTFNYFLELMERLDIQPNGKTWVALIKGLPHPVIKNRAISCMRASGLLDNPSTLRTLVTLTVGDDFISHLNSGQDATSFLKLLDKRWGSGWFSTSAVNQLVMSAVDKGDWEACLQIEKYCKEQNLKLTTGTMNRMLVYCRKKGNMQGALETFLHFTKHYGVEADAITTQTLFSTAWRTKKYNLCRVLWRYACMHGTVTWGTQNRILESLLQNTVTRIQDRWLTSAGKVIVGIDPDEYTLDSRFDSLKSETPSTTSAAHLVGYRPDGPQRDEQRELAKDMLARDLDAVTRFVPRDSLEDMIEEAAAMDKEWGSKMSKANSDADIYWMIENAVSVPVVRRKRLQEVG